MQDAYFGHLASLVSLLTKLLIEFLPPFLAVAGFRRTQCFTSLWWPMSS